jgi:ubiquitin carboxyl-terminal hydrolase 14
MSFQRRVKFPYELDVLDWVTDDLKPKLLPISVRLKEIEKARAERRNVRKKTKSGSPGAPAPTGRAPIAPPMIAAGGAVSDVTMSDGADAGPVIAPESTNVVVHSETMEDEASIRQREASELVDLLPDDLKADVGANYSGLYELVGKSRGYATNSCSERPQALWDIADRVRMEDIILAT